MPSRCFSGLHMAEVVDVTGDKQGLNRIKVKIVSEGSEGITLDHAPVLTDSAGSGYGKVSLPKKGDFVIVAFLDNDMQQPVILGSIPTPTRKPPVKVDSKNAARIHKTADGMEIRIEEDEKNPKVIIKTKSGHTVILEDSSSNKLLKAKSKDGKTALTINFEKSAIELAARTIHFKGEDAVSIKAGDSSVTVSNSSGVSVKSPKGKIELNANAINSKASSTTKIQANAEINIQGSAGANLKSNGVTQVVGSLVKIG